MEYFIKLNIAIGVFYLLYYLFLSKDIRLNLRRIYLLTIIPMAILVLSIEIPQLSVSEPAKEIQSYVYSLSTAVSEADNIPKNIASKKTHIAKTPLSWERIGYYSYFAVTSLLLIRIVISLLKIAIQIRRSSLTKKNGCVFVQDSSITLPYSFFNYIFIGQQLSDLNATEENHEVIHAKELHSLDRIFAEIAVALLWINPFIYFWRKALIELHEFLADRATLQHESDWERYSKQLVESVYEENQVRLTSNFSARILKKRIKMITQDKKQPYWNLLALSALITMVSLGFACVNESNITEKKSKKSPKGDISYRVEYVTTDQLPYYKGELEELAKVLTDNLNYPEEAKKQRVQGTVHVRFLVTETGEIDEVEAINEAHPLLEAEAVRVIKTMPHWVAGKHKREAVAVWRFLPITFKLNGTAVEPQQLSWNSIADSAEGLHDYPGLKRLDKTPQFPGGKEALDLFIAKRNGVVGNSNNSSPFMVCFEVATDGSVGQMVNHPAMKLSERKRLQDIINQMPKWTPAERDGKKVPSYAGFNILVSNDSFEKQ